MPETLKSPTLDQRPLQGVGMPQAADDRFATEISLDQPHSAMNAVEVTYSEFSTGPSTAEKTLGHVATRASMELAYASVASTGEAPQHAEELAANLKKVRAHFQQLSDLGKTSKEKVAQNVFNTVEMPVWLVEAMGGSNLSPQQLLERSYSVDSQGKDLIEDKTLTNFLEWHNQSLLKKQAEFEKKVVGPMRQRYLERFQAAIMKGWVKPGTLNEDRMQKILQTPVLLDDGSGMDPHFSGMSSTGAYAEYQVAEPAIHFPFGEISESSDKVEKTFTHEITHVITGVTPESQTNAFHDFWSDDVKPVISYDPLQQKATFGVGRLFDKTIPVGTVINEATTEHFAIALLTGQIDTMSVLRNLPTSSNYMANRHLLAKLCTSGKEKISPQLFVQAMFEGDTYRERPRYYYFGESEAAPVEEPAKTALLAALERAYPSQDVLSILARIGSEEFTVLGGSHSFGTIRKTVKQIKKSGREAKAKN